MGIKMGLPGFRNSCHSQLASESSTTLANARWYAMIKMGLPGFEPGSFGYLPASRAPHDRSQTEKDKPSYPIAPRLVSWIKTRYLKVLQQPLCVIL